MLGLILGGPDQPTYVDNIVAPDGSRIVLACDGGFGDHTDELPNQDRAVYSFDPDTGIFSVGSIDGMGGRNNSEDASDAIAEEIERTPADLRGALLRAHQRIPRDQNPKKNPGAAYNVAEFHPRNAEGKRLVKRYQAGDVKSVLLEIHALLAGAMGPIRFEESDDENTAAMLYRNGAYSLEAARTSHYRHNLENYMEADRHTPTEIDMVAKSGQRMLFGSDGLFENVPVEEIIYLLQTGTTAEALKVLWSLTEERMKDCANRRATGLSAKEDHRNAVIVDLA